MSRQIRRHRLVRQDLIEIYRYLYERSPEAAERVLASIEKSIRSLLDTPGAGTIWNTRNPGLSGLRVTVCTPYRNYLLFFRRVSNGIELYRVVHGARELGRIIEELELDLEESE